MKKCIVFFVLLTMSVSLSVAGSKDEPMFPGVAIVKTASVIKVFYSAEDSRYARVSIVDDHGNTIFYEVVKARKGFAKYYNIENLLPGNYMLRVAGSEGSQSLAFNVVRPPEVPFSVVRLQKSNKYLVSIPACKIREARVNVFDDQLNLIYSGVEKLNGDFAKVYHVQGVSGAAHIVVSRF
ncbi:MAG: hypothetical protein ACK4RF_08050 [Cyclobacteriaceae bacterium]